MIVKAWNCKFSFLNVTEGQSILVQDGIGKRKNHFFGIGSILGKITIFRARSTGQTGNLSRRSIQKVSMTILTHIEIPLRPTHRIVKPTFKEEYLVFDKFVGAQGGSTFLDLSSNSVDIIKVGMAKGKNFPGVIM